MSSPVTLLPPAQALTGQELLYGVQTQNGVPTDVQIKSNQLSQNSLITLTAPLTLYIATTGNDTHDGRSSATAFATFARAFAELAKFNWAGGFAGTVNIAHGTYNEQPLFTSLVGTVENQITWLGDISGSWGVQLKPTTLRAGGTTLTNAVIACVGSFGHLFKGLWLNAQDPGFGGWAPFCASAFSDVELQTCRLSVADSDGYYPFLVDHSTFRIGPANYDLFGSQAGITNASSSNITFTLGTAQTLNTPTGAGPPSWSSSAIEIFQNTYILWSDTPNWVGWGGTTGIRFQVESGSFIRLFQADVSVIPGNQDGYFIDGDTWLGANFTDLSTHNSCPTTPGAVTAETFPGVGTHNILFATDQWQVFDINGPQAGGTTSKNFWTLSFNDNGTIQHVPLTTKTTDINYQQPANGFSITIGHKDGRVLLEPAAGLATGTITFDANPFPGQDVYVGTTKTITSLTVSPGAGQSVVNAPTTLAAGTRFYAQYRAANTTWYCFTT